MQLVAQHLKFLRLLNIPPEQLLAMNPSQTRARRLSLISRTMPFWWSMSCCGLPEEDWPPWMMSPKLTSPRPPEKPAARMPKLLSDTRTVGKIASSSLAMIARSRVLSPPTMPPVWNFGAPTQRSDEALPYTRTACSMMPPALCIRLSNAVSTLLPPCRPACSRAALRM